MQLAGLVHLLRLQLYEYNRCGLIVRLRPGFSAVPGILQ